ncbi:MAG: hypothetical protein M3N32_04480 [Actinomycetota bacterium]|nr:hypothetical protein [Actinomycetota bacterium]
MDALIARISHHATLRAMRNRWLEILWHCLRKGIRYHEATHVINRNHALKRAA